MLRRTLALTSALLLFPTIACSQTIKVIGTVKDGDGTPLNGAQISIKDGNGAAVGSPTLSNAQGQYSLTTNQTSGFVVCKVISDTTYNKNPDTQALQVTAGASKNNFVFLEVTVAAVYWRQVIDVATSVQGRGAGTVPQAAAREWDLIDHSGLPPDSKAAAARELKSVPESSEIIDPRFMGYANVDSAVLSKAMSGDKASLAKIPAYISNDIASTGKTYDMNTKETF